MEDNTTHQTPTLELCDEKAAKVMRWISESEDISETPFTVDRAFENGVLKENTASFLRLLLDEQFPGEPAELEVTPEKLQELLREAFRNTHLYLLTPHSFIPGYLSFTSETLHINVRMLARLGSFVDYPYFPEMMGEWFTISLQSGNSGNRKSDLKKFLSDTDRLIMKYSTLSEIASYLQPLYDYLGSDIINLETLTLLFDDKGLSLPSDAQQNEFSAEELSHLLKEAYTAQELLKLPEELPSIPEYDSFLKELREIGVVLPPPTLHLTAEEKKILPPLEMFIGSKLRSKGIEKIFHHNEFEYDRAIAMLNEIEDYSQAELNLQTLLQIHKVSADSKVATRLSEALRLRFGISSPVNSQ